jgi:hypothetical protein
MSAGPDSEMTESGGEEVSTAAPTVGKRKRHPLSPKSRKKAHDAAVIEQHRVCPPCGETCKRKCLSKIAEEQRAKLNAEYWNLSWYERRVFIASEQKVSPSVAKRMVRLPSVHLPITTSCLTSAARK